MEHINKKAARSEGLIQINNLLKEKLLKMMPAPGEYLTPINGLGMFRQDAATQPQNHHFTPRVIIVVQGGKHTILSGVDYFYKENNCIIADVEVPATSSIIEASPEKPYLSMWLNLDKVEIEKLMLDIPLQEMNHDGLLKNITVIDADVEILKAFLRLINLIDKPEQIPFLAAMFIREIHFRLLTGPSGDHLKFIKNLNFQTNRFSSSSSELSDRVKITVH